MSIVQLRSLGALEVSLAATTVTAFPTDKIRALLVYLALEKNNIHRREALAAFFWPGIDPSLALNNLRVTLHRLRETLDKAQPGVGSALIESTRQTLQLNHSLITTDVDTFQRLLTVCAAHAHGDPQQCAACRTRLVEAVGLYRGELLAGFGLVDAPAFEEWLLISRETLHQQALAALHTLVQGFEALGDDERAHYYASRQLVLDPSREEAHRQLMRSLVRRGLRTEALAQYESCRRLLRQELDVDPDPETTALVEQIRAGKLDKMTRWQDGKVTSDKVTSTSSVTLSPSHPVTPSPHHSVTLSPASLSSQNWGEAPEVGKVYGRQEDLTRVAGWLVQERCRVAALLGIGGVGKTTLAAMVVKAVATHFDWVLWRSLLNAPPLEELLRDILQRLADERLPDFPSHLDAQLALLLDFLRRTRTLLVLDNLESILQPEQPGQTRSGYDGYAQLLRLVVEYSHQSCLLLTSRERPQGLEQWAEDSPLVRTLPLAGLNASAGQAMLTARGLTGPLADAASLVERYSGNPLALKLVAQTVQELFGGDISAFLAVDAPIFDDIRQVLDQQFARLSPLEQELLLWLAVERSPVTAATLRANLVQPPPMPRFLEALRALQRRSLLETVGQGFALQNVVIEYLTDRLLDQIAQEISAEQPDWLRHYALSKAQSKEYVRQSQVRLILQPLTQRLVTHLGRQGLAAKLQRILAGLHHSAPAAHRMGYTAGNLLQLLLAIGIDLTGYDFSHQNLWQVDLRNVELVEVNLTGADLRTALFTDAFRTVITVAFSQDGRYLAACGVDGIVRLWRTADWQQQQELVGHHGELRALAFSPAQAGQPALLASGGADQTVRIWERESGQLLFTLPHAGWVVDLAFVPVSDTSATPQMMLVSACWDHLVYLWNAHTGVLIATLAGHTDRVHEVAVSPDGQWLASASRDRTVRLWRIQTAQLHHIWSEHTSVVTTVAFSSDGTLLASGSWDCTVCLWEVHTRRLLYTLPHPQHIATLVFSPDGTTLATAGEDLLIRLWQVASGQLVRIISGHTSSISTLDWSQDGTMLVSCSHDQSVRLWDGGNGQLLHLLVGRTQRVQALVVLPTADQAEGQGIRLISSGEGNALYFWEVWPDGQYRFLRHLPAHSNTIGASLALSSDGEWLITGSFDQTVGVWHANSGELVQRLRGHTEVIGAVACGPVATTGASLLASVANDHIFLWDRHSGRIVQRLMGDVCTLAFHPHPSAHLLAGAGGDKVITLWDVTNGQVLHTYHGHTRGVLTLAFHPAGELLASGSWDRTIRLWDLNRGVCVQVLAGHSGGVLAVTFEQAGELLASAGGDATICLWAVRTGQCLARLSGHTHAVAALAFLPAPSGFVRLVSGSDDETIKVWEVALPTNADQRDESTIPVAAGRLLATLRAPGPYAGMNIAGVTGISAAQKAALKALGAVEEREDDKACPGG